MPSPSACGAIRTRGRWCTGVVHAHSSESASVAEIAWDIIALEQTAKRQCGGGGSSCGGGGCRQRNACALHITRPSNIIWRQCA